MAAPPLNITIPPAPPSGKRKLNDFDRFMNAHPQLKQYKVAIQQWSGEFGVPAIWVAATLVWEAGFDKTGAPINAPNKEGTGFGLAQINPKTWFGKTFPPTGETITAQWASDPGNAIKFMAWKLGAGIGTYGTLNATYSNDYNPGFTGDSRGKGPEALLKGYGTTGSAIGRTPTEKATGAVADVQAKQALPYTRQQLAQKYRTQLIETAIGAGYTRGQATSIADKAINQVIAAKLPADQQTSMLESQYAIDLKTLQTQIKQQQALGRTLISQYQQVKSKLDPIYLAYTGKPASPIQVQHYIDNPTSTYQIELNLANPTNNPALLKSPVWLTNAGRYQQYYRDVFGPNVQVPNSVVLYGTVHSLDEAAFKGMLTQDKLPGQAAYDTSEQYKGLFAQYQNTYAQIYGLPDDIGKAAIAQAVTKGWTNDQWANYLRQQPEYTSSGEYKERAFTLANSLGLIQGTGGAQTALAGAS